MNEHVLTVDATKPFSVDALKLDTAREIERIGAGICEQVLKTLRKRGAIVGLSGGIDSSVTAALCARALGTKNVLAVLMPEKDSESESLQLGRKVAEAVGIECIVEDIAPQLAAAGCYSRRDEFIRKLVPEFGDGWGSKVVLGGVLAATRYNITSLVVRSPTGEMRKLRMPLDAYLGIIAATNMKQRTRKQIEYYHADRLNYAVSGTPNRLEYDQGFFVKNGDGAADFKPVAHLYKSQVYQLAEALEIPSDIRSRPPTTDTWSLAQTQDEFYFTLPYQKMDLCLFGLNNGVPADAVAQAANLSVDQVRLVWVDIEKKRRATRYLHTPPLLIDETLMR